MVGWTMPTEFSSPESSASPRLLTAVRTRRAITSAAGAAIALIGLAGCHAVGPDYHKPATTMPADYSEMAPQNHMMGPPSPSERKPVELSRWWTAFNDPMLDSLVDRAVRTNLDLQLATERIVEARANRRIQQAGLFPMVNGDGS